MDDEQAEAALLALGGCLDWWSPANPQNDLREIADTADWLYLVSLLRGDPMADDTIELWLLVLDAGQATHPIGIACRTENSAKLLAARHALCNNRVERQQWGRELIALPGSDILYWHADLTAAERLRAQSALKRCWSERDDRVSGGFLSGRNGS